MKVFAVAGLVLWMALAGALMGCGGDSPADGGARSRSTAAAGEEEGRPIESAGKLRGPELEARPPGRPYPKKLVVRDLKVGSGREARPGRKVTIQFTAIRFDGTPFESSWEFGHPFRFPLGADEVSPGWERGLPGMKVGGRRELLVPWTIISKTGIVPGTGPKDGQVYVVDLLAVS